MRDDTDTLRRIEDASIRRYHLNAEFHARVERVRQAARHINLTEPAELIAFALEFDAVVPVGNHPWSRSRPSS